MTSLQRIDTYAHVNSKALLNFAQFPNTFAKLTSLSLDGKDS